MLFFRQDRCRLLFLFGLSIAWIANSRMAAGEESIESAYLANVRQVTSGLVKAGEGYFSPDGKTIVYQAVPLQYPFYQIYTQPLSGGKPKLISTGRGRTTCSYFSPDGKRLLFASSHLDPQLDKTEAEERRLRKKIVEPVGDGDTPGHSIPTATSSLPTWRGICRASDRRVRL